MKRSLTTMLCAAAFAAPLAFTAAPSAAQGFSLEFGQGGPRIGFYTDGPYAYYNGYRGYRDRQRGYRNYRGYWFPSQAFPSRERTGSIRGPGGAHVEWCYDRYRSYRAWDNTFQPYRGQRRECYSPYS
ncbi:MAG: BA14K family protein [Rhizobiaceae bacterium]